MERETGRDGTPEDEPAPDGRTRQDDDFLRQAIGFGAALLGATQAAREGAPGGMDDRFARAIAVQALQRYASKLTTDRVVSFRFTNNPDGTTTYEITMRPPDDPSSDT